jgi:transglutaminase-like putative cysteine protease
VPTKEAPGSYNGLVQKIQTIQDYYKRTVFGFPEVREWAESQAGRGSRAQQAQAVFSAVKAKVNYVGDPQSFEQSGDTIHVELIKSPWTMIDEIDNRGFSAGDCDDQASLNYTLLKLIGVPAAVRVAWYGDEEMPKHIYALAGINGIWTPFDTCAPRLGDEKETSQHADFN